MLILQMKKLRLVKGNEPHWTHRPSIQTQSCFPPNRSCLYMYNATCNTKFWPQNSTTTFHKCYSAQSFSRELNREVGIVPIQGVWGQGRTECSFSHFWGGFWYIQPASHTLNITVLQGPRIRKERGVLGVKTPDLPHSSLSLFLPP